MGFKKSYTLGIIPARYASTRFPGKLLAAVLGKSVLQRTFESASACPFLDALYVATDDTRIYDHVRAFGGKALMTSPTCPTGTDRAAEAMRNYPELHPFDTVLLIQGDEPCLLPEQLLAPLALLQSNIDVMMATAATPLNSDEEWHNPSIVKCVVDGQQNALYFSRSPIPYRQKLPTTVYKHLGIYCFRREFLQTYADLPATPLQLCEDLEQLRVLEHGHRLKVAFVDQQALTPHVDLPEDLEKVKRYLCH